LKTFQLTNETLTLTFNRQNGALCGIESRLSGWKLIHRPELGLSFRLLVPLSEERRNNPVYGEKQTLNGLTLTSEGRRAALTWNGVTSEVGGRLDIRLVLEVNLEEQQAIFCMRVENASPYIVENVYCPYLGDLQHPPGAAWFKTFSYQYATAQEWDLWPTYQNLRGYYGVDYPTQFSSSGHSAGAPTAPFILLRSADQGLYAGLGSPSYELVAWHTELRPGYGSSIDGRVAGGQQAPQAATRFAAVHLPYIQPGEQRTLTPIIFQAYQGSWHQGVEIYKRWRAGWMKPPRLPAWAQEPHAWQQLHINSPEDELRLQFRELVQVGEECARHGIKAIQLVGWNDGGQDQGNPSHDPDPRLGTFDELKEAIATIHALGVKVILFAKFTWADRATKRFRNQLARLAVKDPYGDYYHYAGYQYQTATQLLDINTKRLIPMCFLSEEYLHICADEFRKMVDLGAAGILFDECLHHSPALLCFDETHGHRRAAPVYANDNKLIENFHRIVDPINPEFLFAGEACYDWEMGVYHLSYHRSENKRHIPLSRYLLPESQLMTAVTGFNDRNMINQCLLYRYIISYEPYHFKGRLEDYPLTLEYGKRMDSLRAELREFFWDGEFRHTQGARVTCNGQLHHPYSVFVNRQTAKTGLVVANYEEELEISVQAELENGQQLNRWRLVDRSDWQMYEGTITIPACSAVVLIP
jgi:hypothetical protein